jgi:hypothetical protein
MPVFRVDLRTDLYVLALTWDLVAHVCEETERCLYYDLRSGAPRPIGSNVSSKGQRVGTRADTSLPATKVRGIR